MEKGNELSQQAGPNSIRVLVLWRDLWSQEAAHQRTVTDLNLDDSRVWINVYRG